MNGLTLDMPAPRFVWPAWRDHGVALACAVALHAGLAYVLLNLAHQTPMPTPQAAVITTQLINLPTPVAPPPPALVAPEPPAPEPVPQPVVEAPQVEQADLAFKRVEQERQEKARQVQRERQQREQALREERIREQQALKEQQLAQARQAEAERVAAAERQAAANAAAAAAARAEAEAASRQYLPIAKQAPDYPPRALQRKIEGECTVAYTVSAAGRVEDPQVVGDCHPFFVKPSLAAAKTFRYQPRVVNGQAVAVANVKNTFSYRIE